MNGEPVNQGSGPDKAHDDEAFFRQGLSRHWARRFGPRPDGLSRLSGIGDAGILLIAACGLAAAFYRPASLPPHAVAAIAGAAVTGLILSHALNRSFRALERRAFAELENELAGKRSTRSTSSSPFLLLAKFAIGPRVRAKHAWIEQRMKPFYARRAANEPGANAFGFHNLPSIHGTVDDARSSVLNH